MALFSYPIFAKNGDRIDLRTIYTGSVFTFAIDSEHPTWLTIESDYELVVDGDAVSETTPLIVFLDMGRCFYLVVNPPTPPSLRVDIDALNMLTDSSYDLFLIVQNADSITFETGQTQPTGSSISDGVFTIGTANGTAYFTATNDDGSIDFAIQINTVQRQRNLDEFSDTKRIRVEIAGIDVSDDFLDISELSETLDAITLTDFTVNDATLVLSSDNTNGYRYNDGVANNFWQTHSLNAGGYQESINIFDEYLVNDVWVSHVVFSGVILRATENFEQTQVSLICVDVSSRLRDRVIADFGTTEKWGVLTTNNTASDFEKEYAPEAPLLPIQPETARAWQDRTALTLQQVSLPTEGLPPSETVAQITETSLKARSLLAEDPLLNFKTQPKNRSLQWVTDQLAITKDAVYQVNLDVDTIELNSPYILNLGNTAFSVEKTRITRIPADWVYDPTNQRTLVLLSTTAEHLSDLLVEYNLQRGAYKVLHAFAKDIAVHRIARRDATNYYILASEKGVDTQFGSIYHYDTDTETLTESVASDDTHAPIWKQFYWHDLARGQEIADKGAFKCVADDLYYRFRATDFSKVGVAELDTAGTTTEMISDDGARGSFAFDVTSAGEIYLISNTQVDYTNTTIASTSARTLGQIRSLTIDNNMSGIPYDGIRIRCNRWANGITELWINRDTDLSATRRLSHNTYTGSTITVTTASFGTITSLNYRTSNDAAQSDIGLSLTALAADSERLLKIQRRQADGTIETLEEEDTSSNSDPYGIHELLIHNDHLYMLAQFVRTGSFASPTSAVSYLRRYDTTTGTGIAASAEDLADWNDTTDGGVHLFVHDGSAYFMLNLPLYTLGAVLAADDFGALNRIETDGSITPLGNLWYDNGNPYKFSVLRPLSIGDDLHFTMGYGNVRGGTTPANIFDEDSDISNPDNFLHLVRTLQLQYMIANAAFSGSPYDALAELARLVNATLSFEQNIIHIRDRSAIKAETDGNTGV